MKTMKKAGILSAAATLAASVVFVGAAAVANAAPVAVTTDLVYVAPGEAANVTIDGCSVGATLTVLVEGEEVVSWEVADGDLPATEAFSHDEIGPGQLTITAECAPADEEAPSSSDVTLTFFGSAWLEADPEEFNTGDPVTITAGDFLPGEAVALDVYPAGSDDSVFTHALGTAGEDFSVTGVVVFPADLECGEYVVELTSEAGAVAAELYICGAPDPTPTPTPSETVSPTPSPSVTTSPTAAPTTPSPQPGLPSTGR